MGNDIGLGPARSFIYVRQTDLDNNFRLYDCNTGCFISGCMKTNAYQATKNTLLGHKNNICIFLRCGHLIFNHSFLHSSMDTYVKCTLSFWLRFRSASRPGLKCQILSNQDKIASFFQDSERTSASTETNNTSYESPDIQLFGARRMRAWHHHGSAHCLFGYQWEKN